MLPLIFRNLEEIRKRVSRILGVFAIFLAAALVVRIQDITLFNHTFLFLYPSIYQNVSAQFMLLIEHHILPKGTTVFILKPADGVLANLDVAMFLSLVLSMPVIVKELGEFIGPALKKREKEAMRSSIVPASLLFIAGSIIGLWYVAPPLFAIFNGYDLGLGATATLSLMSFISFTFLYTVTFGISFEVPVIMVALTRTGIVQSKFWVDHWRHAVVGALIFGMVFSPGVIGFTMVIMALPIIVLYFGGIYFARRAEAKKRAENAMDVNSTN